MDFDKLLASGLLLVALGGSCGETLCFDFESGDLQGWQVTEGSFGRLITDRSKEYHTGKPLIGKQGRYFLSTLDQKSQSPSDGFTGVVESPCFRLLAPEIRMRIGGGSGNRCGLFVCDESGKRLASVHGENSQRLVERRLSLPDQVGNILFFRIVDNSTGGWGHLLADEIVCKGEIDRAATLRVQKRIIMREFKRKSSPFLLAVEELGRRFPDYPAGTFRERLREMERRKDPSGFGDLQMEALIRKNPLLNRYPILYTTRDQYRRDHHNTATIFQVGEVNHGNYHTQGALKLLDVGSGRTRTLLPEVEGRTIRDPEVDDTGTRIVFSMREGKGENYKIWKMGSDGSGLTQLTDEPRASDIDPCWLPNGDIVFSSTREPKYCMCNRHIMCNLYRMKGNGANIHQIGKSTLFEGNSTLLPDGRILYDRWEYVDRNFGDAQGLWVCNQDGTAHAIYWGNNTTSPGGVIKARPLSTSSRVIAVLAACHDQPWGALGIIDRSKGVDGAEPVLRTWPASFRDKIHVKGRNYDSTRGLGTKYADPFPLDDAHFICVRTIGKGSETGLFYLDLFGNEILFHAEKPGCHGPVVVRPSRKRSVHPIRRNFESPHAPGYFYLQNVYIGTHMKGVKPGTIKALRIVESPEKRQWTGPPGWAGQGEQAAAMNWHNFENKRILGTVPVEADGSAYFEVPGNTFVFFQALDREGKMVQSMRSGAYVQPGERYGCVGCHENRTEEAPEMVTRPLALTRKPDRLKGWYGPPRLFSFQKEVQPIFTRHCVACHDYGKPAGEKLNLSGDRDPYFSTSYYDLWGLEKIRCVGAGPAEIQEAYSWGSHASKLTERLYGHGRVRLTPGERDRIITWMDLNAPFYPCYESAYPQNPGGRSPITFGEQDRLRKLTGIAIPRDFGYGWVKRRSLVNLSRPELSRILDGLRKPGREAEYAEALSIIRTGAKRLEERPRADMEGFVPCGKDREREIRYQRLLEREREAYRAIREGRELFDERIKPAS